MTRQDQFKQELFALLRKYRVEMSVKEDEHGYPDGIAFWSYTGYTDEGDVDEEPIDFALGAWVDGKE